MADLVPLPRWIDQLARFSLIRVRTEVNVVRDLSLREPACSQIRSQLGALFREQRCLTGAPTCTGCSSKPRCDFARVFDAAESPRQTHAFWLQGIPTHTSLRARTHGEPTLWLLDKEASSASFLGEALRRALLQLGRPPRSSRWEPALRVRPVQIEPLPLPCGAPAQRWTIVARTPMDLRTDDPERHRLACPEAPEFSMLVEAAIRRLYRLAQEAFPSKDFPHPQPPDLTSVHRLHGGFDSFRNHRFSQRQGQAIPLSGWVGELSIEGDALLDLSPLLHLLPTLSVGKKTTMGFGWVDARPSCTRGVLRDAPPRKSCQIHLSSWF
ncbi:MAG: CRISPR system precrRNA processing endoribonuclease RAMP protein Cas6 [Myxococcales bacterium]|nr:CRISPR system precrRNA processing endoribonuclease RAMP protein Cas6 [Polyangiaceae bacterium]MDW8250187.1 CRISPR system precrRNA processing endoribonuclease RAMP protein Cas6 [Myxococcales bacterium]